MKFDVVVGNVVPIFDKREQYERFKWGMHHIGRIVEFMAPEQWVAVFSDYPRIELYAEVKYAVAYDPKHFINQIKSIARGIEREVGDVNDTEKLLILISKQIVALTAKVDIAIYTVDFEIPNFAAAAHTVVRFSTMY